MQEQTSTKKKSSEPNTNGTTSNHKVLPGQQTSSRGGAGNLAAAIDKLVEYLEESERAKVRSGGDSHHMVMDIAQLKEWLERYETRALGSTPGGKPVAQREEKSSGATSTRDSKAPRKNGSESASAAPWPVQPAKVFYNGYVKTKVWANHEAPGSPTWSVQQVRVYNTPKGYAEARSFRYEHLRDAMRGAYQAQCWIRKNRRRHRLLGWFLGY